MPATHDMKMEVKNRLSCIATSIGNYPIAGLP